MELEALEGVKGTRPWSRSWIRPGSIATYPGNPFRIKMESTYIPSNLSSPPVHSCQSVRGYRYVAVGIRCDLTAAARGAMAVDVERRTDEWMDAAACSLHQSTPT